MSTLPAAATASWGELLSGRNGLRSLALCGGVAVHAVNVYIVTTILPSVVQDIGGIEYYAWNTTLFVAASILGSALSASSVGFLGLRASYLFAILVFMLGSIAAALSPTMLFMLGARTVQGLGGGLLLGLSYTSVRLVFQQRLWPKAMALISSMWGVATVAGPAIGGIFAESGNWRLAFWSIIPVALIITLLVATQLQSRQENRDEIPVKPPLLKIALLTGSVIIISFGSLAESWLLVALSVVLVLTILYGISRDDALSTNPLFPTGTYSISHPLGSLYAGIALMSIGVISEIYVPYFLQMIHEVRPLKAGYMTALMSAGWTSGAILMASRSPQFANTLLRVSPVVSALSLAMLGVLLPWQQLGEMLPVLWLVGIALYGVGLGVGMIWPHLLTRVFSSAEAGQENLASASITTLQLYAMSIGAAVAGMITVAAGFNEGTVESAQQAARALLWSFALAPLLYVWLSKAARQVDGTKPSERS